MNNEVDRKEAHDIAQQLGRVASANFADVKSITIPEGAVKRITNSQGAILWEKSELDRKKGTGEL